jgi:hypothetical protein
MTDVVDGLPVHILVIHAVVVLIPLMFIVTLAFALRPVWRPGLPWAILGNLVATGAAIVAKFSGQDLQARLSARAGTTIAADHADRGALLPFFAMALLAASVIAYLLIRQGSRTLTTLAIVLVLITGSGATYWTYLTGDSGSRAVWEDNIASTQAP